MGFLYNRVKARLYESSVSLAVSLLVSFLPRKSRGRPFKIAAPVFPCASNVGRLCRCLRARFIALLFPRLSQQTVVETEEEEELRAVREWKDDGRKGRVLLRRSEHFF